MGILASIALWDSHQLKVVPKDFFCDIIKGFVIYDRYEIPECEFFTVKHEIADDLLNLLWIFNGVHKGDLNRHEVEDHEPV